MTSAVHYSDNIKILNKKISELPPDELRYHLMVILQSIEGQNWNTYYEFSNELIEFTDALAAFHRDVCDPNSSLEDSISKLESSYENCLNIARVNRFDIKILNAVLGLGGAVFGLFLGICGGIVGGIDGFVRGLFNWVPVSGLFLGFSVGFIFGAVVGNRIPQAVKYTNLRQLEAGLAGFKNYFDVFELIQEHHYKKFEDEVRAEIKQELAKTHVAYESFVRNTVTYKIMTKQAAFIPGPHLKGFVGNHAFITIDIAGTTKLVEFNNTESSLSDQTNQLEERKVDGETVIKMLALHRQLRMTTHPCNMQYMIFQYAPGEDDCFSYINLILFGTGQEGYKKIDRFHEAKPEGRLFNFFVSKLNPVDKDHLNRCLVCNQS